MLTSALIKTKTILSIRLMTTLMYITWIFRFQIFRLSFYVYNFEQFNKLSDFSQILVK